MDSGSSAKQLFDGMPQLDDLPQDMLEAIALRLPDCRDVLGLSACARSFRPLARLSARDIGCRACGKGLMPLSCVPQPAPKPGRAGEPRTDGLRDGEGLLDEHVRQVARMVERGARGETTLAETAWTAPISAPVGSFVLDSLMHVASNQLVALMRHSNKFVALRDRRADDGTPVLGSRRVRCRHCRVLLGFQLHVCLEDPSVVFDDETAEAAERIHDKSILDENALIVRRVDGQEVCHRWSMEPRRWTCVTVDRLATRAARVWRPFSAVVASPPSLSSRPVKACMDRSQTNYDVVAAHQALLFRQVAAMMALGESLGKSRARAAQSSPGCPTGLQSGTWDADRTRRVGWSWQEAEETMGPPTVPGVSWDAATEGTEAAAYERLRGLWQPGDPFPQEVALLHAMMDEWQSSAGGGEQGVSRASGQAEPESLATGTGGETGPGTAAPMPSAPSAVGRLDLRRMSWREGAYAAAMRRAQGGAAELAEAASIAQHVQMYLAPFRGVQQLRADMADLAGCGHPVPAFYDATARTLLPAVARCFGSRSTDPAFRGGGCGNPLFLGASISNTRHVWRIKEPVVPWDGETPAPGAGSSALETAYLVQSLLPRSVEEGESYNVDCIQGPMRVCDVRCAVCGSPIGWRFLADATPGLSTNAADSGTVPREGPNFEEVGKYGIVLSAWTGIQRLRLTSLPWDQDAL